MARGLVQLNVLDQRGVTLFDALWAFYQEHHRRGELDSAVERDRV